MTTPSPTTKQLKGIQKAAILMVGLGPDSSAEIFKHLSEAEIDLLSIEIAKVRHLRSSQTRHVIDEFYEIMIAQDYMDEGGIDYAHEVLEKALGSEKAKEVITRITTKSRPKPFQFARTVDTHSLFVALRDEHPQTIAVVLSQLETLKASAILSLLDNPKRSEVAKRVATLTPPAYEIIEEIERVIEAKLSTTSLGKMRDYDGVDSIVTMLNQVDRATERSILESLEVQDPLLVTKIRQKMFIFENLPLLDARSLQRVMQNVQDEDLIKALKVTEEEIREVLLKSISTRRAETVLEELEMTGPIKLKEVEEAQGAIVAIVRQLEQSGEITITRPEGDEAIG